MPYSVFTEQLGSYTGVLGAIEDWYISGKALLGKLVVIADGRYADPRSFTFRINDEIVVSRVCIAELFMSGATLELAASTIDTFSAHLTFSFGSGSSGSPPED